VSNAGKILPASSRFHHVGVACRSLDREEAGLAWLGYGRTGELFTDEHQGISGVFLEGPGPRLELLEPLEGRDVLDPWLEGRAKMYHLAYEVDELDPATEAARNAGARPVSPAAPAVAFGNRRICFIMLPSLFLVELIEAEVTAGT
jgi:methylmalonyl-CoA/ethylmalonyl-CoA epimerase